MSTIPQDLTGRQFGRWTVVVVAPRRNRHRYWLCLCECGTERTVREDGLKNGCSRSCGCLIADTAAALLTTHGKTHSPEHYAWKGMRGRCENPNNPRFGSYGARGIAVCERWRESFEAFYADMGPRPTPEHSMDRIDNDGPYSPENCRWATPTEQNRNTSRNHLLTHNGETLCISEWAERTGIRKGAILSRLDRGWSVADALSIL